MARWMLNCKEYSQLVSEGMDGPLSLWDRVCMSMHRLLCPPCDLIKKQIDGLRKACRFTPPENQDENDPSCMLPQDARMRIKKVLRDLPKS